jgi:hypothetical protein
LETRLLIGGLAGILIGVASVLVYLNPDANAITRAIDYQSKLLTFPKSLNHRTMYLISGLVAIFLGILALSQAAGIIHLPVKQ